jgi:hypothetical protein
MFLIVCYGPEQLSSELPEAFYDKAIAHIIFWPIYWFKLCVLVIAWLIITLFNLFLLAIK